MEQTLGTKDEEKLSRSNKNNVIRVQASKVSKEQNAACKRQNLGTRISAVTLEQFRKFVVYRHGKINGPFSQEVENALEFYMNKQQQTTSLAYSSISKTGRPRADTIEKYRQIAIQLKKLTTFPYVNHFTLAGQIRSVLGECDKRTFDKYLKFIRKLCKEEQTGFAMRPMVDASRFVEKIMKDDW